MRSHFNMTFVGRILQIAGLYFTVQLWLKLSAPYQNAEVISHSFRQREILFLFTEIVGRILSFKIRMVSYKLCRGDLWQFFFSYLAHFLPYFLPFCLWDKLKMLKGQFFGGNSYRRVNIFKDPQTGIFLSVSSPHSLCRIKSIRMIRMCQLL